MEHPIRNTQPEIKTIEKISIAGIERIVLDNGIPLYIINAGQQDLIKFEILFEAGSGYQEEPLSALYANKLLIEGTRQYTSQEIAEKLDFFGAQVNTYCDKDFAGISTYCLNKYTSQVFPLVEEIIFEPRYSEEEFQVLNKKQKQNFLVNQNKVKNVARERFFPLLFGETTPYGKYTRIEDYDQVSRESIIDFYKEHYNTENCIAILSGKVNREIISNINQCIGQKKFDGELKRTDKSLVYENHAEKDFVNKDDALQSALRIGRIMFNKLHDDYLPFKFLSTLLGGYFGSRLMSNIREDKGFTYGIGSNIVSLKDSGYFFIATEVGVDVRQAAIDEIYAEIKRLREEKVSGEEMDLVRTYMLGKFMHSIDGPFGLAENYRNILEYGLDRSYFDKVIQSINTVSAEQIQQLANKYLTEDQISELIVGK